MGLLDCAGGTARVHCTQHVWSDFLFFSEKPGKRRIEKDVAYAVKTLLRDGEKAFSDRCLPYIMRMYDNLNANDCWIADNHTFDIQSYLSLIHI